MKIAKIMKKAGPDPAEREERPMEAAGKGKTLILNGSPRRQGDTAALLRALTEALTGEYRVVDCWREDISPCIDCRACRKERRCVIRDAMQEVYRYAEDCTGVVIASPIYFAELTGKLLDTASRFQVYYAARAFRGEDPGLRPKKGGVLLAGGGTGDPRRPYNTAKLILRQLNVGEIFPPVCSGSTDTLPAGEDGAALAQARDLAAFLNG